MSAPRTIWPAAMSLTTAAAYLDYRDADVIEDLVRKGQLTCIQPAGPQGQRRIRKETLDAYLEWLEQVPCKGRKSA